MSSKNATKKGDNDNGHSTNSNSISSESKLDSTLANNGTKATGTPLRGVSQLLRVLVLDFPLMLLFAAYVTTVVLDKVNQEYLTPQLLLMDWNDDRRETEVTSYHYVCTDSDITASSADELVVHENMSRQEIVSHMQVHGATIFENILSNATADELRDFILEANHKEESFWVIEGEKRFSFGVKVDHHPSVAKALQEIANHPFFRPNLEAIVGENPAIIEFTAITSIYGAAEQFMHQDVLPDGSAAKYARSFMPSYSLFIPLQDTSEAMGATEICPGTQICSTEVEPCERLSFPASGSRDKWKKGAGALLNQQTTHRGTAHKDPNGPERVVFILTFAPRPLFNDNPGAIETRQIGKGGSYSLQYQHYGHTLDDFGNSAVAMREPFRTLRSFGIYKPPSAQWGWDMITVNSMRVSYGDNGFNRETLEEFVEEGGFWFLPKFLQAEIIGPDFDEDEEPSGGWYSFLVDTLNLVQNALAVMNLAVLGIYVLVLILFASIKIALGHKGKAAAVFLGNIGRLLLTHSAVVLVALLYLHQLSQTHWARHIKTKKLYQTYDYNLDGDSEDFVGVTLPNKNDVLIGSHLQSRYLASYSDILDFNVPGNRFWRSLLDKTVGFDTLTPALQDHLCADMIQWLGERSGRLLEQFDMGQWKALQGNDAKVCCYKQAMAYNNALFDLLMRELAYVKSETKFGSWRSMSIHRKIIPKQLSALEHKVLLETKLGDLKQKGGDWAKTKPQEWQKSSLSPPRQFAVYSTTVVALERNKSAFYLRPVVTEPFKGAWLEVGDDVEGKYQSVHNGKKRIFRLAMIE